MKIGAEKLAVVALIAVAVLAVAMLRPGARSPTEKNAATAESPDDAFVVRGARAVIARPPEKALDLLADD